MKIRKAVARAALTALTLSAAGVPLGCGLDQGYYAGPPYVIGHYFCVNPYSGQPDDCVEYSDGTSAMVPFGIWNTVPYGSTLSYAHSTWVIHSTPYTRAGSVAPDVFRVHYVPYSYHSSSAPSYQGMSYVKNGRVIYRGPTGASYKPSSWSRH